MANEQAFDEDTIVAIASAGGRAARGIVRLSGPGAAAAVSSCLDVPVPDGTYVRREARFALPETAPFPVVIYVMRAPRSYTREDVVEIHAPGAPPLLAAIAAEMTRRGARQAEPGEFTKRAFLNGRIDLAQAEAVLALIRARSDDEERLALSALGGDLSREVRAVRATLMNLAVDIEAGLDFSEEDVSFVSADRLERELSLSAAAVAGLLEASISRQVFREEVLTVLFGAANAGKSSLFNLLSGGERAITHETPGTTRDFLEAPLTAGGVNFLLVDTAGVRDPAEVVEAMAVERSRGFVREAQLVLFVLDASEAVTPEVEALYEEARRLPHIVVLNKSDRPHALRREDWVKRFCDAEIVETSAATGAGRDALLRTMVEHVQGGRVDFSTMRWSLAARQRRLMESALEALSRARDSAGVAGEEIVAYEVRDAAESLGRITGEDYVGDLLDEVFSRFCLGK